MPLWQLTGEDYVALHAYAVEKVSGGNGTPAPVTRVTSIHALAQYIHCSDSLIFRLRREGVLDDAVISRVGKTITFDAEAALRLANEYQAQKRANKSEE